MLGSFADVFAVDRRTGAVSSLVTLTRTEQSTYEFSVTARDSITPNKEALCRVTVVVMAAGVSNNPIFTIPPDEGVTYHVQEASTIIMIKL